jgi:hypothetical protein
VEDVERKPEKGMLARRIDVAAPELPAEEGSAHLNPLLAGVERVQGGGAQERSCPLVSHSEGKAGRICNFGLKQPCKIACGGWQRCRHAGPHRGVHEVKQRISMPPCQRDKGKPVPGQDCLVVHCSIDSGAGQGRNGWGLPEK